MTHDGHWTPGARSAPGAGTVAVAVRFRLGELLPGTDRTIGLRDHVVHKVPLRQEDLELLHEGRLIELETFCGIRFRRQEADLVATQDLLRLVGCDACQLIAPPVTLV